jgi:hypothetical protein
LMDPFEHRLRDSEKTVLVNSKMVEAGGVALRRRV